MLGHTSYPWIVSYFVGHGGVQIEIRGEHVTTNEEEHRWYQGRTEVYGIPLYSSVEGTRHGFVSQMDMMIVISYFKWRNYWYTYGCVWEVQMSYVDISGNEVTTLDFELSCYHIVSSAICLLTINFRDYYYFSCPFTDCLKQ